MTKVMAGVFILMFVAVALGMTYLGGEISGGPLDQMFNGN